MKRKILSILALPILVGAFFSDVNTHAQALPEPIDLKTFAPIKIFAFWDDNVNGKYDQGEKPLADGGQNFNGTNIILSDFNGSWSFPVHISAGKGEINLKNRVKDFYGYFNLRYEDSIGDYFRNFISASEEKECDYNIVAGECYYTLPLTQKSDNMTHPVIFLKHKEPKVEIKTPPQPVNAPRPANPTPNPSISTGFVNNNSESISSSWLSDENEKPVGNIDTIVTGNNPTSSWVGTTSRKPTNVSSSFVNNEKGSVNSSWVADENTKSASVSSSFVNNEKGNVNSSWVETVEENGEKSKSISNISTTKNKNTEKPKLVQTGINSQTQWIFVSILMILGIAGTYLARKSKTDKII